MEYEAVHQPGPQTLLIIVKYNISKFLILKTNQLFFIYNYCFYDYYHILFQPLIIVLIKIWISIYVFITSFTKKSIQTYKNS